MLIPSNPLDKLIAIEWDIIEEVRRHLDQSDISVTEKAKLLNSLAFHTNALTRLLTRKEQQTTEEDEITLAELIAKLPKKYRYRLMRQIKKWMQ